jgi:hypothetical protein
MSGREASNLLMLSSLISDGCSASSVTNRLVLRRIDGPIFIKESRQNGLNEGFNRLTLHPKFARHELPGRIGQRARIKKICLARWVVEIPGQ